MNHEATPAPISVPTSTTAKRVWSAPEVRSLRVEQTELASGYYGELVGMNGCTIYNANAATNVCVAT